MKLLFDENLSARLVELFASEFPGSVHVEHVPLLVLGLQERPDRLGSIAALAIAVIAIEQWLESRKA